MHGQFYLPRTAGSYCNCNSADGVMSLFPQKPRLRRRSAGSPWIPSRVTPPYRGTNQSSDIDVAGSVMPRGHSILTSNIFLKLINTIDEFFEFFNFFEFEYVR
ncbi:hypothetical protein N7G274_006123 [Stereocaulon virgatum]|uniref:Uncharacterized protein n=1 Tax=Stereocaulon virgatum TaxID=373712 RepID=A0ABR4A8V6_9LECA